MVFISKTETEPDGEKWKDELKDGTAGDRPRGVANDEQRCPKNLKILLNSHKVHDVAHIDDKDEEWRGDSRW